jgi:benzoate membrane transport protein
VELRQPVVAGVSIALVAYTSTFAVVLGALRAVGASPAEASSGLLVLCVAAGVGTLWLALRHRQPFTLAWSTPGAAVLAGTGAVGGGWPEAVGAFVVTGLLVVATGLWSRLGALIRAIPAPIAQAMLAGVVLKICIAPLSGLDDSPWQIGLMVLTWLVLLRAAPRWAVPVVFVVMLAVVGVDGGAADLGDRLVPQQAWTSPHWGWEAVVGLAVPLYVVTMAAQNVPGVAIVGSFGYSVPWRESMALTGTGTLLGAPWGGHAINLAAISAAVPASEEAHPDPRRRWPAAVAFGGSFLVLAAITAPLTAYLQPAPAPVLGTVAALGLLSTLAGALGAMTGEPATRVPATLAFLVAASEVTLGGIGSAFWALVVGVAVHAALSWGRGADAVEA